jgi:beta-lactamase superfamily II metal-dependent hydrolase
MAAAMNKWWDDCVSTDSIRMRNQDGSKMDVYLLWGDRVRVLDTDSDRSKVFARGSVGWVPNNALGGEPLLEIYVIDVGQGDGILVVTPEGHHIVIDGGDLRTWQQTGKNAADFIDWKFFKDYRFFNERDINTTLMHLDALIVSHADRDHYGGLHDLVKAMPGGEEDDLNCAGITVENFYHPGLCPQKSGTDELGPKQDEKFVLLLEDRDSATSGMDGTHPLGLDIRGQYGDFIEDVLKINTKVGDPTPFNRLSHTSDFLPGFGPGGDSAVKIKVLGPIETTVNGAAALADLGNQAVNKNGHSVALRLDYGDRNFLLAGDLNDKSQKLIMDHYDDAFKAEWKVDVAKACHHGSHEQSFEFLQGLQPLASVISSGDANTYDHPRAWILGALALVGRVIKHGSEGRSKLKAPLVYSTEIARSLNLKKIEQLRRFAEPQEFKKPIDPPEETVSGDVTLSKWRVVFNKKSDSAIDNQPVSKFRGMQGIIYGLVNVRSDGKRLLFAVRNEGNKSWAYETIEESDIEKAVTSNIEFT